MKLPLLVSVPHAGLRIPPEAWDWCQLTPKDIEEDGDVGAADIYDLKTEVTALVTTDVARAIVDMNRAEDDRRPDGVVKTATCWHVPVYKRFLPDDVIEEILARYHRPYHQQLTALSRGVRLGVDLHTMAAEGPPEGPDPGVPRPRICLSDGDGTCSKKTLKGLAACFEKAFDNPVSINDPFKGGYIIRAHAKELPWVQVELSRDPWLTLAEKRVRVQEALSMWCRR